MWLDKLELMIAEFEETHFESPSYAVVRPEVKSEIASEIYGESEDVMFLDINEVAGLNLAVDFCPNAKEIVLLISG